jgi:uncharacterized protein YqjF (DUF2071 family)
MRHRWSTISFLHWSYPAAEIQRRLPAGLEVEPWDGKAWVGLVPFEMTVRPPVGPGSVRFPETNVRTYVVGPDGRPGVFFFSLDAGSATAVTAARSSWQLPYFLARMSVVPSGDAVRYRSERRRPGPPGAGHDLTVVPGAPISDPDEFTHYLTARFTLWNTVAGAVMRTQADHPPWELQQAEARELREDLLAAAGLPAPVGPPRVHFSTGVDVRIGAPRPVGRSARSREAAAAS